MIRNTLLSWQFQNMSRKERCSQGISFCLILFFTAISVSGLMLRLKANELSEDPSFKAPRGWYEKWKRRHSVSMRTKTTLAQRLPADLEENIVRFHRFACSQKTCWLPFIPHLQYGWDTYAFRASIKSNIRIQRKPNSASKILWSGKAELHCCCCRCCRWNESAPKSHLQRRPDTKRLGCTSSSSCFFP